MQYVVTACFIMFDILSGLVKSFAQHDFKSEKMRVGLFHKAGFIILLCFGILVDYAQGFVNIGVNLPIAEGFCVYIITMEIGSIVENICIINPQIVPSAITKYFSNVGEGDE